MVEQAVCVAVIVLGGTLMHLHAAVIRSGVYAKHLLSIHFGGCGFAPPTALLKGSIIGTLAVIVAVAVDVFVTTCVDVLTTVDDGTVLV